MFLHMEYKDEFHMRKDLNAHVTFIHVKHIIIFIKIVILTQVSK